MYTMLEKNPWFNAVAVQSIGLQSPAYWELYCYTDCWRHLRNKCPNTAFVAA